MVLAKLRRPAYSDQSVPRFLTLGVFAIVQCENPKYEVQIVERKLLQIYVYQDRIYFT